MKYIDFNDGTLKLDTLADLILKLQEYAAGHGLTEVELVSIEDNTWSDKVNGRFDIEIRYPSNDIIIQQKLFFLKGEIIDGEMFHKCYKEFY